MSPRGVDLLMTVSTEARLIGAGALAVYIAWRNEMIDFAMIEAPVELQPLMLVVSIVAAVVAVVWVAGYAYQEYLKSHNMKKSDEAYSRQYIGADVLAVLIGVLGGMFGPGIVIQGLDIINAGALGWTVFAGACAVIMAVIFDFVLHFGVQRFFTNVKKIADDVENGIESIVELKRSDSPITEAEGVRPSIIPVVVLRRDR